MRRLSSYYRVQKLVSWALRGRRFQLRGPRPYLQIGCGPNAAPGFTNVDAHWCPGVDVCWDVTRGLPFADGVFKGVFSEHCLEHIPFDQTHRLLREVRRVLAPGGVIRIVVPDGGGLVDRYARIMAGEPLAFPPDEGEYFTFFSTPMTELNRGFYCYGHRFLFDFPTLKALLEKSGFARVERVAYGQGRDPALVIDTERRREGSLFVEASP